MKTKRQIGNKLEDYLAGKIQVIDKYARRSKASGASTEIGDTSNKFFITSCKKRNTESVVVKKKEWDKLLSEIPIGSKKIPIYVLENKSTDRFVVMNLDTFFREFAYKIMRNEEIK